MKIVFLTTFMLIFINACSFSPEKPLKPEGEYKQINKPQNKPQNTPTKKQL